MQIPFWYLFFVFQGAYDMVKRKKNLKKKIKNWQNFNKTGE